MKKLRILWVEDNEQFGPSVHLRIEDEIAHFKCEFEKPRLLIDGNGVWEEVRDWRPHVVMMDHNLENVRVNGANLIEVIRHHDHETPIIFYSSEMDADLVGLVEGEHEVYPSSRDDVHSELVRLIKKMFG